MITHLQRASGLSDEHLPKTRSRCCKYSIFEKGQVDANVLGSALRGLSMSNSVIKCMKWLDSRVRNSF